MKIQECLYAIRSNEEGSTIKAYYESSDQKKYLVPCPHCGKYQELKFGDEKTSYGLKPIYDKSNRLIDAYYECEGCHELIYNHHKAEVRLTLINRIKLLFTNALAEVRREYYLIFN